MLYPVELGVRVQIGETGELPQRPAGVIAKLVGFRKRAESFFPRHDQRPGRTIGGRDPMTAVTRNLIPLLFDPDNPPVRKNATPMVLGDDFDRMGAERQVRREFPEPDVRRRLGIGQFPERGKFCQNR